MSGDELKQVLVSFGSCGVAVEVTLKVEPRYTITQSVFAPVDLKQLISSQESLAATMAAAYSVSVFTRYQDSHDTAVWTKHRHLAKHEVAVQGQGANMCSLPSFLLSAKPCASQVHPIPELDPTPCTEQGVEGPWWDRLPHFRLVLSDGSAGTPSVGDELQSEYFVACKDGAAAIAAIKSIGLHLHSTLAISELRAVKADDLAMSPCRGRDSLAIHFTWRYDGGTLARDVWCACRSPTVPTHFVPSRSIAPIHVRNRALSTLALNSLPSPLLAPSSLYSAGSSFLRALMSHVCPACLLPVNFAP